MEFYTDPDKLEAELEKRFNSQRDGILLRHVVARASADESFNSQRDGILLFTIRTAITQTSVSIPNGMEFYFLNAYNAPAYG